MENITTEYLIMHEDSINWEELSEKRLFSLVEIRLFRSKIHWKLYLHNFGHLMSLEMYEVGSKYFTKDTYTFISFKGVCPEEFVLNHIDNFSGKDICFYIFKAKPSDAFLMEISERWVDKETAIKYIKSYITPKTHPKTALLLELK